MNTIITGIIAAWAVTATMSGTVLLLRYRALHHQYGSLLRQAISARLALRKVAPNHPMAREPLRFSDTGVSLVKEPAESEG